MSYASLDDVRSHLPQQIATLDATSQPAAEQVTEWLEAISGWIDAGLAWRYRTPVTDAASLPLLRRACAMLAASLVWQTPAFHGAPAAEGALELAREARRLLAYQESGPHAGRSLAALPGATPAEEGEAAVGHPAGSFTDPEYEGPPRIFVLHGEW